MCIFPKKMNFKKILYRQEDHVIYFKVKMSCGKKPGLESGGQSSNSSPSPISG